MKPIYKYFFAGAYLVFLAAALYVAFIVVDKRCEPRTLIEVQRDTLIVRDTVRIAEYKEVTKKVTERQLVPVTDTVVIHDTTYIVLERETKQYRDSLFCAQISGIDPSLDWIDIYTQTRNITTTVKKKPVRWGIGVQAGYGLGYMNGKIGSGPYIGVGIDYHFAI